MENVADTTLRKSDDARERRLQVATTIIERIHRRALRRRPIPKHQVRILQIADDVLTQLYKAPLSSKASHSTL